MEKTILLWSLSIFLLIIFNGCSSDDGPVYHEIKENKFKNLVIVSDLEISSNSIVTVIGKVRSYYPDINITFFPVKKFDIYEGAYLLNNVIKNFSGNTVFAGLVEPGAGGKRIVYSIGNKRVFTMDNGMSTYIFSQNTVDSRYYVDSSAVLDGAAPSQLSFEEFYARAIVNLISSSSSALFGKPCLSPVTFLVQEPAQNGDTLFGQVLYTDYFGNCISNIPENLFTGIPTGAVLNLKSDTLQTTIIKGLNYSSVNIGEKVCFINSSKYVELSINYGNFSDTYKMKAGSRFKLIK